MPGARFYQSKNAPFFYRYCMWPLRKDIARIVGVQGAPSMGLVGNLFCGIDIDLLRYKMIYRRSMMVWGWPSGRQISQKFVMQSHFINCS